MRTISSRSDSWAGLTLDMVLILPGECDDGGNENSAK